MKEIAIPLFIPLKNNEIDYQSLKNLINLFLNLLEFIIIFGFMFDLKLQNQINVPIPAT